MNFFVQSIFFGVLSAFFALVAEQIAYIIGGLKIENELFLGLSVMILAAAAIEEVIKFAMIFKNSAAVEDGQKVILSCIFFGLGFSAIEVFLYAFNGEFSWQDALIPLAGVVSIHIITSGFAGLVISKKQSFLFSASAVLITNFLLHTGYNLAIINLK